MGRGPALNTPALVLCETQSRSDPERERSALVILFVALWPARAVEADAAEHERRVWAPDAVFACQEGVVADQVDE